MIRGAYLLKTVKKAVSNLHLRFLTRWNILETIHKLRYNYCSILIWLYYLEIPTDILIPHTHTNCICFPRIIQNNSHMSTHSWLPWTSTTKLHFSMLSLLSCAVQLTYVCPIGNLVPVIGIHVMFGFWLELSTATGSFQTTTAVACPGSVWWVWFCGQKLNTGDSISKNERIWQETGYTLLHNPKNNMILCSWYFICHKSSGRPGDRGYWPKMWYGYGRRSTRHSVYSFSAVLLTPITTWFTSLDPTLNNNNNKT